MSKHSTSRRREKQLPETAQKSLFFVRPVENGNPEQGCRGEPVFRKGKAPGEVFIGENSAPDYLAAVGLRWVLRLREAVSELDYSKFFPMYEGTGRQPFHPAVMVGLIVYGMLKRQWSLRELESLARLDVGAWVICGGTQPDHSTIGKFIVRHTRHLTEEFFVESTRILARKMGASAGEMAIDGTVIEAAASHLRTLRAESARVVAQKAQESAMANPDDKDLSAKASLAEEVAKVATERAAERKYKGRDPKSVKVARSEPEAMVQKQKNGSTRPSYKPSIAGHGSGLIVGKTLHPSSETSAVEPLLEQHNAIFGAPPEVSMLDAGYYCAGVLQLFLAAGLNVLIPSGKAKGEGDIEKKPRKAGAFLKNRFVYDAEKDVYICPAGQHLAPEHSSNDGIANYKRYRGCACDKCAIREQCTTSKSGRTIKRYEGDDIKDAMTEVMRQPLAQKQYRRRAPLAERPIAELKQRQGLQRFHRKGSSGAGLEWSLHCLAFNLGRVAGVGQGADFRGILLFVRAQKGSWLLWGSFWIS